MSEENGQWIGVGHVSQEVQASREWKGRQRKNSKEMNILVSRHPSNLVPRGRLFPSALLHPSEECGLIAQRCRGCDTCSLALS